MTGRIPAYVRRLALGVVVVVTSLLIARVTSVAAGTELEGSGLKSVSALRRENQALASRVEQLEESVARLSSVGVQPPSRVQAPFEVVDAAGNSLLLVTGDPSSSTKKARVTIARASGDNFVLSIRNTAGNVVSSIGEGKTGAGVLMAADRDGKYHATLVGDRGLVIYGNESKEIANLGLNPDNKARALLWINGELRTLDGAGNPVLNVTDAPGVGLASKARVTVARGSGDNFGLTIRNRSGGVVAALAEVKTGAGGIELHDAEGRLRTDVSGDLGYRLLNSELKEIANLGSDPANKGAALLRIRGEMRSEDPAGKPILTVTDATSGDGTVGRVHIGRGAANNYGIWVRGGSGTVAAAIGEGKTGGGVVTVSDQTGKPRADLFGQGGMAVYSPSGKEVVTLNLNADNTEAGILQLRGTFQLFNGAGQTMVEAGTLPTGLGVVRVGPRATCTAYAGMRVPDCIMGHK